MNATGSPTEEENKLSATAERFCRRFSLAEIQSATQDFSETNLIGNGGFGKVYRGQINDGEVTVAIKRLTQNSNQGAHEFVTEIETLSKLRHINLVSLIGYCNDNQEMILVYDYISRGTLAENLYTTSMNTDSEDYSVLSWKQRLNICVGAARGLDYLHTGTSIIHRDVKSTNILLDENFRAKVSDFGLAKHLSAINPQSHVSTIVKGSFGYLDPSYFTTGRLTRQSDTYAFGVVLLEVLCGRPAVDARLDEDEMSLVMWAQQKMKKGKVEQIVASYLREEIAADCLKTFMGIAKRCLKHDPKKRPTMGQVLGKLELALEQQNRKAQTLATSRFLPFWNRDKPSGSLATGLKEFEQISTISEVAVPAIAIHNAEDKQRVITVNDKERQSRSIFGEKKWIKKYKADVDFTLKSLQKGIRDIQRATGTGIEQVQYRVSSADVSYSQKSAWNDEQSVARSPIAQPGMDSDLQSTMQGPSEFLGEAQGAIEQSDDGLDERELNISEEQTSTISELAAESGSKLIKEEWIEQYEPGVYITVVTLQDGTRQLKRLRFSGRRFGDSQAEAWWATNREKVCEKYNVPKLFE